MPIGQYYKKYRSKWQKPRRKYRRRQKASSIEAGWKRKAKRKRGSLVARTAKANRTQIKKIKRSVELKWVNINVMSNANNFTGQILPPTPVDNLGYPQRSQMWVTQYAADPTATKLPTYGSSTSPTLYSPYCPLICQPLCIKPGTLVDNREGEIVNLKKITMKLNINGGFSNKNGGIYSNKCHRQHVHVLIVLDRHPQAENSTLNNLGTTASPTQYQPSAQPCMLFPPRKDNPISDQLVTPGVTTVYPNVESVSQLQIVRSLLKSASTPNPGARTVQIGVEATGTAITQKYAPTKDLYNQGFYSKDFVGGKDKRFKILKHMKIPVDQIHNDDASGNTQPKSREVLEISHTLKCPYKLQFRDATSSIPVNQNILYFFFSDVPTISMYPLGAATTAPVDFLDPPVISAIFRVSFKDP